MKTKDRINGIVCMLFTVAGAWIAGFNFDERTHVAFGVYVITLASYFVPRIIRAINETT